MDPPLIFIGAPCPSGVLASHPACLPASSSAQVLECSSTNKFCSDFDANSTSEQENQNKGNHTIIPSDEKC